MSDVKRYSLSDDYDGHDNYAGQFLREDDTGDYVKAVDFDALQRERDGLKACLLNLVAAVKGNPPRPKAVTAALMDAQAALDERWKGKASGGGEVTDG